MPEVEPQAQIPGASTLIWHRIHWNSPVPVDRATSVLRAWAGDQRSPQIVLEARGSGGHVRYLIGTYPAASQAATSILTSLLPDVRLTAEGAGRSAVRAARLIKASTRHRALRSSPADSAAAVRVLLAALTRASDGEEVVLQIVLGPRRVPLAVPTNSPSSIVSPWYVVAWHGNGQQVDSEKRGALRTKVNDHGFACAVRIGVQAQSSARAQTLTLSLMAAIRTSESSGLQLRLTGERPNRLTAGGIGWRWPLRLNVAELTGLTAWPLEADDLPGQPAAHPKPIPPVASVTTGGRVVAVATAPGVNSFLRSPTESAIHHTHVIGPTGSGKTNLLLNLITQDIDDNRAVVVIEPRGDLVHDVLERIPERRRNDVVVLDPGDETPVGINPLNAEGRNPEVVADGVLSIFKQLYGEALGPRSTDILHASLLTLAMHPGANLVMLPLLLTNPAFRRRMTAKVTDPVALGPFWAGFERWSEGERAAAVAPVMNKLRPLLRPSLRAVLAQPSPRFRMHDVFTRRLILLVPLQRGVIGADAGALLGSLIVAELWRETQARAGVDPARRHPVMVYIDEVQDYLHLPTDIGDALAQARGLGVGFTLAHQLLSQLPPDLRSGVLANSRSRVVFQTAAQDARELARGHSEVTPEDLTSLGRYEVYASLYADGKVQPYASGRTLPATAPICSAEELKAASRSRFGTPRDVIEASFTHLLTAPSEGPIGRRPRQSGAPS